MNRKLDAFKVLGQRPSGAAALCGLAIVLGMFTLRPLTASAPVEAPAEAPIDAATSKAEVPADKAADPAAAGVPASPGEFPTEPEDKAAKTGEKPPQVQ